MSSPIDQLIEAGFLNEANELKKYKFNCIPLIETENKGLTKTGGIPDLPPEIRYPTLTGYTMNWKQGRMAGNTEQYAQSAMQLVLQLDLDALYKSGCDTDRIFPASGMLWIFWSGEIGDLKSGKLFDVLVEQPSETATHRVIYWNGDKSCLRPTPPPCPYYSKYFTEPLEETFYDFSSQPDFPGTFEYNYSSEVAEALENVFGGHVDFQYDNCYHSSKLLGHPAGSNGSPLKEDEIMLFQFDYGVGCLGNLFFKMRKNDLIDRNFSSVELDWDLD